MATARMLVYEERGDPASVLRVREEPVPAPGPGEVLIQVVAAALHPSDLGMIGGTYGRLPDLPAVGGREAVGRVTETGEGVPAELAGRLVRVPERCGAWRSHAVARAGELYVVPGDPDPEQAALAFINPPTALRLLADFAELRPGDWVVQNAGNSAVGVAVSQVARSRGLHTASLVRRADLAGPLREIGADVVLVDGREAAEELAALAPRERVRLGLNSVGGESVVGLTRMLGDGADLVTFGGMTGEKIRFPTRQLIFNDLRLRGFWMDRWTRTHGDEAAAAVYDEVFALIASGTVATPVSGRFALEDFSAALEAQASPRLGKVLFLPHG